MQRPSPISTRPGRGWPEWALRACAIYLLLAFGPRVGLPFLRFPAFRFPVTHEATVVPLFLADGRPADVRDYEAFVGLDPGAVDVEHRGYACSNEHALLELRHLLAVGAVPAGTPPGPVRVEVGLRILSVDADGALVSTTRVDAAGTARPRSP